MDIRTDGFLSEDIEKWRLEKRSWFGPQFRIAIEISRLGMTLVPYAAQRPPTPQNLFFSAFFIRALTSLQGSVVMAERGLITEARTLLRSVVETLFYMEATRRNPQFVQRLGQEHVKRMNKMAADHIAVDPNMIGDDDLERLTAALKEMADTGVEAQGLQIIEAAKEADLLWMYRTFYAELSTNGAHPTFVSVEPIWNRTGSTDEPRGVRFGPTNFDTDALPEQLVQIAGIGYHLLTHANRSFQNRAVGEELERIGVHILELTKEQKARDEARLDAMTKAKAASRQPEPEDQGGQRQV